jgi:hypothetical protein
MEWKPIDTAPIGKEILLRFKNGETGIGANVYKPTANDDRQYIMHNNPGEFKYLSKGVLSHWCELPELPTEE